MKRINTVLIALLAITALSMALYQLAPTLADAPCDEANLPSLGVDWKCSFRPAALDMLHGDSPYSGAVFNPPWVIAALIPLAVLPFGLSYTAVFAVGLAASVYAAAHKFRRLGLVMIFLLSPFALDSLRYGNVDWLVILGAVLPPQIGLFLVLAKPQLGGFLALYWLWQAWRRGGLLEIARVFAPVTLALAASFAVYGPYMLGGARLADSYWNLSLFPASIPLGLALLFVSLWRHSSGHALAATPFLSPYVGPPSWCVVPFGLSGLEMVVAVLVQWVVRIAAYS